MSKRQTWPQRMQRRIEAAKIAERLEKHILGEIELSSTQVTAANILLKKVWPDLKAVEHSGEVTNKPPRKLTNDELRNEIARYQELLAAEAGGAGKEPGAGECDSVH